MQYWNVHINNRDVVAVFSDSPDSAIDYIYETRSYDIHEIWCDSVKG
jgi:hypothetical protein